MRSQSDRQTGESIEYDKVVEEVCKLSLSHPLSQREQEEPDQPMVIGHVEPRSIDRQEFDHCERSSSLVAVNEAVIFRDSNAQTNGEREQVLLAVVVVQMHRSVKCAYNKPIITNALRAAVDGNLLCVNR